MSKQAECHGLATQHSNMVAPHKVGQELKNNTKNWQVVKSKKTLRAEKKMKKNYPTTSKDQEKASSPDCYEYSSDDSSYCAVVKRNMIKEPTKHMSFWETYNKDSDSDDKSTTSSITLNSNTTSSTTEDKSINSVINKNKKLKKKAKNLKNYIKTLQNKINNNIQQSINKQIDLECAFSAKTITEQNEPKKAHKEDNATYLLLKHDEYLSLHGDTMLSQLALSFSSSWCPSNFLFISFQKVG